MCTTRYDIWKLYILRDFRRMMIRSALFWVIRQQVVVISRPSNKGRVGCPETSVRNYHYSLRNNPEERSSQHCLLFT
jgi:hypothetical protein